MIHVRLNVALAVIVLLAWQPVALVALEPAAPGEPAAPARISVRALTGEKPAPADANAESAPVASGTAEAKFTDESTLRLVLREEKIDFETPYGKLTIPTVHVRRIQFGVRLSDEQVKRIKALISQMGDADFHQREAAGGELLNLKEKAYSLLLEAGANTDPEISRRAKELVQKLRDSVTEDRLTQRSVDVIHTGDSRITGRVLATTLKAGTQQFGEVQVKLADLREINTGEPVPTEPTDVQADPGTLSNLQAQVGKTLAFRLTAPAQGTGSVWGTGVYTLDSHLVTAAMHSGVLKPGQTKVIRVLMMGPTANFTGSTQNGVTSNSYSSYPGAYKILKGDFDRP